MSGLLDKIVGKNEDNTKKSYVQYIKAIPLRAYEDIDIIKAEVRAGNTRRLADHPDWQWCSGHLVTRRQSALGFQRGFFLKTSDHTR